MRESDILNEENADGQQRRSSEKHPGDRAFCFLGECNPRHHHGQQQGKVTKLDYVHMRIDFSSAIFEKGSDIREIRRHGCTIAGNGRVCGSIEAGADTRRIWMQYEDREDVAENHADDD